jgi:hypothetical protein
MDLTSRLVEEDSTKVIPTREHIRLMGQIGTARVHQVDAG